VGALARAVVVESLLNQRVDYPKHQRLVARGYGFG